MYDHQHTGHVGVACAISSQSYKMINSGEGGFVLTNDPDIAAQTAVYAGAYESLSSKHITVPSSEYFKNYPKSIPNYSLRMSELTAAIIRPQINTLEERIRTYERRYRQLVHEIEQRVGSKYITIPQVTPEVTRMVHDSLQFHLDTKFTPTMVQEFVEECQQYGLMMELFGHVDNARNYINWQFVPTTNIVLPQTSQMLQRSCDIRLPYMWKDTDFDDMANIIVECIQSIIHKYDL
jgi:dTDP-4-amino-4,6-dideoxygalactose transaminase